MVGAAVLGICLLIGLVLLARWYSATPTRDVVRTVKWILFGLLVAAVLVLLFAGRLGWAIAGLAALAPWAIRLLKIAFAARAASQFARGLGGGFGGGGGRAAPGQTSDVTTRYLRMTLDHDSGAMSGTILGGPLDGRPLGSLSESELAWVWRAVADDADSLRVFEAWLDREGPADWRRTFAAQGADSGASAGSGGGAPGSADMTAEEARAILGVAADADPAAIKDAYHRLIAKLHPDHGGSSYLAAKLNQAKDLLLHGR